MKQDQKKHPPSPKTIKTTVKSIMKLFALKQINNFSASTSDISSPHESLPSSSALIWFNCFSTMSYKEKKEQQSHVK